MEKSEKNKIVLTGGHAATTAISVVQEIARRKKGWKVYWIGAEAAIEGKRLSTLESEVFPSLGVSFHSIKAGRLQRKFSIWTIPSLVKIPLGFFQALILLIRIRPKLVLSFGAFSAFPVVVAASILGIEVIVHEQTVAAGRANRASGLFAKKIALARKQSEVFFPREKCVVVGNPILEQIVAVKPKKNIGNPPTILITCGSRGSQTINEAVEAVLEELLSSYVVIHQTGPLDYQFFLKKKESLPVSLSKNYQVVPRINPTEMAGFYRRADIVIGRAGANTVSEIITVKRPSILIPIPWSYLNEQAKNAREAEKAGIARIINQDNLTGATLLKTLNRVKADWVKMVRTCLKIKNQDISASKKLVDLVEDSLG